MKLLLLTFSQLVIIICMGQSKVFAKTQLEHEKSAIAKIMYVADSLFEMGSYQKAINYYKRIIGLEPGNQLAKSKIEEVNDLLSRKEDLEVNEMKLNTDGIIINAKSFQEKRIENYQMKKR